MADGTMEGDPVGLGATSRRKQGPNYHMLIPLIYAPLLPIVRIGLNRRVAPGLRDKIFLGCVFGALAHAGYIMSGDSTMGAGT